MPVALEGGDEDTGEDAAPEDAEAIGAGRRLWTRIASSSL